jgi:tRNA(fMet)-specific endonuclease VapC
MEARAVVVDTSIFIDYLRSKKKEQTIFQKLPDQSEIFISSVTLFELLIGASSNEKWEEIKKLTEDIPVLGLTDKVAAVSAQVYHELKKSNKIIEYRDIFIAATAMANDLPVLTLNKKDFKRIKNLKVLP